MTKPTKPSENGVNILAYLKNHYGTEINKRQIIADLHVSMSALNGTILNLKKKGYLTERIEETELSPATETRKAVVETNRFVQLTESGLSYDPIEVYNQRMADYEAEKAAKAAAKASAEA